MNSKFTSEGIIHCPKCRGVVIKDFKNIDGHLSFNTRCPHCQESVHLDIDAGGKIIVSPGKS